MGEELQLAQHGNRELDVYVLYMPVFCVRSHFTRAYQLGLKITLPIAWGMNSPKTTLGSAKNESPMFFFSYAIIYGRGLCAVLKSIALIGRAI